MFIESLIRRKDGSQVQMTNPDTIYIFAPNSKGHHVAEVTEPSHVERFLKHAGRHYREYAAQDAPADSPKDKGKK